MTSSTKTYVEDRVTIGGVVAVRRRKAAAPRKTGDIYLHVPMQCISLLGSKKISASAWPLALWVIWHHRVSSGAPATLSEAFAARAEIHGRSARRCAVQSLEKSGLFQITRKGTEAVKVTLGKALKTILHAA